MCDEYLLHLPSGLYPEQNNICYWAAGLSPLQAPGFERITIICTNARLRSHLRTGDRHLKESIHRFFFFAMKIRVRIRLFKIRIVIPACLRFRKLIHCLVRTISFLRTPDRTPRTPSFLCLRRTPVAGSPLEARTRGPATFHPRRRRKVVSEGCVAVYVGEERRRFVIPIVYLSHPFITTLLAEAEGCDHGGPLTLPCDVGDFEQVKWLIDKEKTPFQ